jgi:Molybdopterin cofactor-binding domain
VRVVAPDVGGGFAYQGIFLPKAVVAAFLARRLVPPVHWLEDRLEQLTGNASCREPRNQMAAYADRESRHLRLALRDDGGRRGCRRVPGGRGANRRDRRAALPARASVSRQLFFFVVRTFTGNARRRRRTRSKPKGGRAKIGYVPIVVASTA